MSVWFKSPTRRTEGRKGFTQPPFWAAPDPWLSLSAPWSSPDKEKIGNDFVAYCQGAYMANGIVFACMTARQLVFTEARFQWQEMVNGRPGDLFDDDSLAVLDSPEPLRTTGDMLSRVDNDAVLSGNYYSTLVDERGRFGHAASGDVRVVRMRPDWVTFIIHSPSKDPYALDARVVSIIYEPTLSGGKKSEPVMLLPTEVCHYAPHPDPQAWYRGMSPLTPILRDISADKAATQHKESFFNNGAMLSTVVKFPETLAEDKANAFIAKFKARHRGPDAAFETLFLGGGADVTVVGTDLTQVDFRGVTGGGETRVAAALRVHPVIVGLSEGMQGSSLNAGNFNSAKRGFVDGTMRPFWRMAAGAHAALVTKPDRPCRLWYDDRDIAYLREDAQDAATILSTNMTTINSGITAGYEPDAVTDAVVSGDLRRLLGKHTGLVSVQLTPPGTDPNAADPNAPADGKPALPPGKARKRFNPDQERVPAGGPGGGRWGHGVIAALVASLRDVGGHGGVAFGPDGDDGHIDWGARRSNGDYGFDVFNGRDTVQFDMTPDEMTGLHAALTDHLANPSGDTDDFKFGPNGEDYVDWRAEDGVEFGVDGDAIVLDMDEERRRQWHTALTLSLLVDATGAAKAWLIASLNKVAGGAGPKDPGAKRFDPGQLRDPHSGEWTNGPGGPIRDALKLAGRIDLDDDEHLLGSAKLDSDSGGIRLALIRRVDGGHEWRVGFGGEGYGQASPEDDLPAWDANPGVGEFNQTAALDDHGIATLDAQITSAFAWAGATGQAGTFGEGVIPGTRWGDIHWQVYLDDPAAEPDGPELSIGVLPKDDPEWANGRDWRGYFTPAETRKLLRLLAQMQTAKAGPVADAKAAGHDTTLGHDELHHYWTRGAGLARWRGSPKPWTTLVALLTPHVGPERARVFASKWFHEVFGIWPGERGGRNPAGPG